MNKPPPKPELEKLEQTACKDESVVDSPAAPLVLDFLAAARESDELGRLGAYRVLRVLGKGGMGVVFLAQDTQLDRHVALKVMLPRFAEDRAAKQRFLREAKSAAAIEHDHIVHIYQVGEDRGVPFLAMQLLTGSSLEDVLRRSGRLKTGQVLRLGIQIAEGLAAAHARGLVHRDIKPANIWVEVNYGGRVKLLDFGLARSVETDVGITQSGVIVGTPAYMPPEQARGEKVDHRCDLYSLGCVLYRMGTGELPHRARDMMGLLTALALHEPTPPKQINDALPEGLSDLILGLLAKDPKRRPESALRVAVELKGMERELGGDPGEVGAELMALAKVDGTEPSVPVFAGRKPAEAMLVGNDATGTTEPANGITPARGKVELEPMTERRHEPTKTQVSVSRNLAGQRGKTIVAVVMAFAIAIAAWQVADRMAGREGALVESKGNEEPPREVEAPGVVKPPQTFARKPGAFLLGAAGVEIPEGNVVEGPEELPREKGLDRDNFKFPEPPQVKVALDKATAANGNVVMGNRFQIVFEVTPDTSAVDQQLQKVVLWVNDYRHVVWENDDLKKYLSIRMDLDGRKIEFFNGPVVEIDRDLLRSGANHIIVEGINKAGASSDGRPLTVNNPLPRVRAAMHGVLIGVGEYHDSIPRQSDLSAHEDVQVLARYWQEFGGNLYKLNAFKVMTNKEVTPQSVKDSLGALRGQVRPDDLLVFVLAGKGLNLKMELKSIRGAITQLIPRGADHKKLSATYAQLEKQSTELTDFVFACGNLDVFKDLRGTVISMKELNDALVQLPCHKLVLLDTSHSGAAIPSLTNPTLSRDGVGPVIIAACRPEEVSLEMNGFFVDDIVGSVFTQAILETLTKGFDTADVDKDGRFDAEELYANIRTQVPAWLEKLRENFRASPDPRIREQAKSVYPQNPVFFGTSTERRLPIVERRKSKPGAP